MAISCFKHSPEGPCGEYHAIMPSKTASRTIPSSTATQRKQHLRWLLELTGLPTAAGKEDRVIAWMRGWVAERRNLVIKEDRAGNLFITQRQLKSSRAAKPLLITAHLDHPAFVVCGVGSDSTIELEFRGGVHDPYFEHAAIEVFDGNDRPHQARIVALDGAAKPFKRVIAALHRPTDEIVVGDIGRWHFGKDFKPHVADGLLHTHACDDLAALAAALATLDVLRAYEGMEHVGLVLTRAEEIGFIGAIASCKLKSVPKAARLLCLENSRSFAESPIGGGPILRVGDKMSVFHPALTNQIGMILTEHQKSDPTFKWQRKLMPGGTCEATTFSTYGYESTCICLPLGNYHNMHDIDGALAGRRPAKVGPEYISVDDYHGMIRMLVITALSIDAAESPTLLKRMDQLHRDFSFVLERE